MPRPILATIRPAAVANNLRAVRRFAPRARIWAVVKANAYGHGIERVYGGMAAHADGFAMLDLAEAERVRALGWTGPLLLLEGLFEAADVAEIRRLRVGCAVHSNEQIAMLAAAGSGPAVDVHLKVNTGMNRLGFKGAAVGDAYRRLRDCPNVGSITWMTHFATADATAGIDVPLGEFARLTAGLPGGRSVCNSAALIRYPQAQFDWVRPGIMQYGSSPFADTKAQALGLEPAMTLCSQIIDVQELGPGDAVGYGRLFVAEKAMRIGVIACGYADGYPRHAQRGAPIWVGDDAHGCLCPLVGRVSMDMLTVDLSAAPRAHIGTPVELWGRRASIDDVATASGTVGYELMCALAPRVPVRVED